MRILALALFFCMGLWATSGSACEITAPDPCSFHEQGPAIFHRSRQYHRQVHVESRSSEQVVCSVTVSIDEDGGLFKVVGWRVAGGAPFVVVGQRTVRRGMNTIRVPCSAADLAQVNFCYHGSRGDEHETLNAGRGLAIVQRNIRDGNGSFNPYGGIRFPRPSGPNGEVG